MMENRNFRFAVKDNVNFYRIEPAKTLLHFTEFDFTYFWEQCIDAGKQARKSGRLPQNIIGNAKTVISRAHPYIEACLSSEYSEIVTDCIIEYICHSERIGLEELWARCISPKNLYETAIFRRISEYKTNRAMNRWTSIVRLQEYARNKIEFIYGTDDPQTIVSDSVIHTRKQYFDLMLSVAANELGCPAEALPSVKICAPVTLPNAAFAVSKLSKAIYRRYSETLVGGRDMSVMESRDCSGIRDQLAMEAYSYVKSATRPNDIELNFAMDSLRETPSELFLPDSLKAVLDLEFDLMEQSGICFRKCENCGRYFATSDDNTRCDRVNSSGKTCRKQYEELVETITSEARANVPAEGQISLFPDAAPEEAAAPAPAVPPQPKREPVVVPKETEKRAQKLYNSLYKRVGKSIDENEFKEWSQYLSNMKKNLKIGEATLKQYEEFLDYSDRLSEEVKIAGKNKTKHAPVEKTYDHNAVKAVTETASETAPEAAPAPEAEAREAAPAARVTGAVGKPAPHVPQVEAAVVSSNSVKNVKPFVPQAFDTLQDALLAGPAFDDDDDEPIAPEKKTVEIKMPQWERMTREEAFGNRNFDDDDE